MGLCMASFQDYTLTNPTSGALCQFSGWRLNSPLCRKSLSQEHRASLLQVQGEPAPSLPSRPSLSVSLPAFLLY